MRMRNARGATLALIVASIFIVIVVGVGLFFLMQVFGGFRELQHATDAGNLNIAKEALKIPNFPLQSTYQLDFTGLQDGANGMDLLTYNRVVGQAYLVGVNAMADRPQGNPGGVPNPQGLADAMLVAQAANAGDGTSSNTGVGQQLYHAFSIGDSQLFSKFSYVANSNSTRMLGSDGQIQRNDGQWDIAFMEPGGATNVYTDTNTFPYLGDTGTRYGTSVNAALSPTLSTQTHNNQANLPYLTGYTQYQMGAGGTTWSLYGVPLFPGSQPHHVAGRDFYAAKNSPLNSQLVNVVPPNAFKSVSDSANKSSTNQAQMEAYSIVGSMNNDFQVSIPNGFIAVVNPPGITAQGYTPEEDVFNTELMPPGISLGSTNGGGTAFTTNQSYLNQWANYNWDVANGVSATPPGPNIDSNGNPIINFTDGSSPSDIAPIQPGSGQTPSSGGQSNCQWFDVQGDAANSTCQNLLPNFQNAYPTQVLPAVGGGQQLMAVEKLKQDVMRKYPSVDGQPVNCPANPTGLRVWNNGHGFSPVHRGSSVVISHAGTINDLFNQVLDPGSKNLVVNQVAQRMHEMDPATSEAAAASWLTSQGQTIDLGQNFWIYHTTAGGWQLTQTGPPGLHGTAPSPDGSLQRYTSGSYQTIGIMVNPPHEEDIHAQLFTQFDGNAATTSPGIDVVDWQPSSGYKNLLGVLTFRNYCAGAAGGSPGGVYEAPD